LARTPSYFYPIPYTTLFRSLQVQLGQVQVQLRLGDVALVLALDDLVVLLRLHQGRLGLVQGDLLLLELVVQARVVQLQQLVAALDRKSTRLNSSHQIISYAV